MNVLKSLIIWFCFIRDKEMQISLKRDTLYRER